MGSNRQFSLAEIVVGGILFGDSSYLTLVYKVGTGGKQNGLPKSRCRPPHLEVSCHSLYPRKARTGLYSQEEWTGAAEQMKWRNTDKLLSNIVPSLRRWVKVWFALLLMTTSILLIVVFLVYFFIVFRTFLDARIVSEWVNISYESSTIQWQDFGLSLEFEIDTVFLPTIKVSFILAIFVAVMSIVYALTEDSFKEQLTEWLSNRVEQWLAASSMYLSITRPDYQVWDLTVDHKRSGRVNVSIVIPRDLTDDAVRRACEHLDSRLEEYRKLVVITAFEQRSHDQRYRLGIPGKRWQYINNKSTKKIYFQDNSLVADEIRYQDFLGTGRTSEW